MKRTQWHFQQLISRLGLQGLIGLALLIGALLLQILLVLPKQKAITEKAFALQHSSNKPTEIPTDNKPYFLESFYKNFPEKSALSQQVRDLHAIASKHQLVMGKVDYKLLAVDGLALKQYQISFETSGDYPTLRAYIAEVLLKLPNASFDSIEFQRFNAEAAVPIASISLTLFFRDAQ